jgi:HAD superfamily hydrolase (TIGR01509 family)
MTMHPRLPQETHAGSERRLPAAVLWDMDGTIIDTEPIWHEAEFALTAEYGVAWTEADCLALTGTSIPAAARLFRGRGVELPEGAIEERLVGHVSRSVRSGSVNWRPGALELLESLRQDGVPQALVTTSYASLADAVLSLLPAGTFAAVVTGDQVTHPKPHPEPYLRAALALGVRPCDAVALEDSPPGVASAHAAGVPVVAVQHVIPLPAAPGRTVTDTLAGVTPSDLGRLAWEIRRRSA